MAIEDYIPNVFGGAPTVYQGLLNPKDQAALERRANLGGLLGFAGALAQGMSPQGYRRSALQNVLSALGAGFQGAGQTYESGINQLANVQKLQQSQAQIEAVNKVLADPTIDAATKAYIRANPADGLKLLAERSAFQEARKAYAPTAAPSESANGSITLAKPSSLPTPRPPETTIAASDRSGRPLF